MYQGAGGGIQNAQASHSNAHIGSFQCRRIIDNVTDHANSLSALLNANLAQNDKNIERSSNVGTSLRNSDASGMDVDESPIFH